jgi:hypothetical protein
MRLENVRNGALRHPVNRGGAGAGLLNSTVKPPHLLSVVAPLKFPRAQFRRHLEKSQFAGPAVFDRRAVRD